MNLAVLLVGQIHLRVHLYCPVHWIGIKYFEKEDILYLATLITIVVFLRLAVYEKKTLYKVHACYYQFEMRQYLCVYLSILCIHSKQY